MQHIYQDGDGVFHLDAYFDYLTAVAERMPPNARKFVQNRDYFRLFPHNSLHDAWLDALIISEPASGDRSQFRNIQIELRLLGSYHDRQIWLTYENVRSYTLLTPAEFRSPPYGVGHGDLLIHEVRLSEAGYVVHELLFSRGSSMVIECDDLIHHEALLTITA